MESKKPVDLLSATSIVAASMIGAGVFTTSGYTLTSLQSPGLVVLAWIVAGIIAICGAICYGALAGKFAESGGEYLFLSKMIHPVAGMMAGWVSLLAGFTGAMALAATTFSEYLSPFLSWESAEPESIALTKTIVACGIVILMAILHTLGVKVGTRVQDTVVILKFLLIAGFVGVAGYVLFATGLLDSIAAANTLAEESVETPQEPTQPIIIRFATQLVWISLSYSGFQAAVYVAGEVKDAKRNVPRAMYLGTILVTIAYLLLNAIFVFGTPGSEIMEQKQVATLSANAIGGSRFELFTRVVILICLVTSVSALTITGPRVYSKMADDGFLPAVLRFKEGTSPARSIWMQAVLAIIVISISQLPDLLSYLGFTLSISAALTAGLLFFNSELRRNVPMYPMPAVVFVFGTLLTASLGAWGNPIQAFVAVGTIAFGAAMYPFFKSKSVQD